MNNLDSIILTRRQFIKASSIAPLVLTQNVVNTSDFWSLPRELWLVRRTRSGLEQVKSVYWANNDLHVDGYKSICTILRDLNAPPVQMDFVLLDILRGVQGWLTAYGIHKPIIINSGYRSTTTNAAIEGAARNSMHMYGKAADIWIDGVSTSFIAKLGLYLSGGGVGYYAAKNFVHVDSGKLRAWRG